MTIKETIAALDQIAATPRHDAACEADDIGEAEYLLATCEPKLSSAAFHHMMGRFMRKAGLA